MGSQHGLVVHPHTTKQTPARWGIPALDDGRFAGPGLHHPAGLHRRDVPEPGSYVVRAERRAAQPGAGQVEGEESASLSRQTWAPACSCMHANRWGSPQDAFARTRCGTAADAGQRIGGDRPARFDPSPRSPPRMHAVASTRRCAHAASWWRWPRRWTCGWTLARRCPVAETAPAAQDATAQDDALSPLELKPSEAKPCPLCWRRGRAARCRSRR